MGEQEIRITEVIYNISLIRFKENLSYKVDEKNETRDDSVEI